MGSALCTNKPRRRHANFEKANPDDDNSSNAGQECSSLNKLKRRYREQQCESPPPDQKKLTTMVKSLTLREWILSSPGREPGQKNAGQECLSLNKLKRRYREQQCESPPPDQKKLTTMVKSLTLREWILSSPGREPGCSYGGKPLVFSPQFKRVYPPSLEVYETSISMTAMPCKARDSFSFERPLKISGEDDREEEQEEGVVSSASIRRTESGTSTKNVTFRLPEEADIIIFYSPRDEY